MKTQSISLRHFPLRAFLLLCALIFTGCQTDARAMSEKATPSTHASAGAHPQFQSFVGTWYSHASALIIEANGHATYDARVYTWCEEGVPQPCDTINGNIIISGIHMQLVFTQVKGMSIYGTIIASSIGHVGSSVSLTQAPNHTATLVGSALPQPHILCDRKAPAGLCGA